MRSRLGSRPKYALCVALLRISSSAVGGDCPFDLKETSGWDLAEIERELLARAYGVPKHSFGYRFLTEAPTGFVDHSADATRILGSVFEPFFYKLNVTKPDLPPRRTCSHADWKQKLEVTSFDGRLDATAREDVPERPDCAEDVCSCYLRYSEACPREGYKTYFVPVPWWWCYYNCQQTTLGKKLEL